MLHAHLSLSEIRTSKNLVQLRIIANNPAVNIETLMAVASNPHIDADILISIVQHQNVDSEILNHIWLNKKSNIETKWAIANSPKASSKTLDAIAHNKIDDIEMLVMVVQNPNTSGDTLAYIWHEHKNIDNRITNAIKSHLNTSDSILIDICKTEVAKIHIIMLKDIALDQSTSANMLHALAESDKINDFICAAILVHPNTDAVTRNKMEVIVRQTNSALVLNTIALNPHANADILRIIIGSNQATDPILMNITKREDARFDMLQAIMNHANAGNLTYFAITKNIRADSVMLNEILDRCGNNVSDAMLANIASHHHADIAILGRVALHENARELVFKALLLNNLTDNAILKIIIDRTQNLAICMQAQQKININLQMIINMNKNVIAGKKLNISEISAKKQQEHDQIDNHLEIRRDKHE
jgi:hypothetical protein